MTQIRTAFSELDPNVSSWVWGFKVVSSCGVRWIVRASVLVLSYLFFLYQKPNNVTMKYISRGLRRELKKGSNLDSITTRIDDFMIFLKQVCCSVPFGRDGAKTVCRVCSSVILNRRKKLTLLP